MPYVSERQRAKFHLLLKQGKISQKVVDEFDKASEGLKLPIKLNGKTARQKAGYIK